MTGKPLTFDMYRKYATVDEKASMNKFINEQAVSQAGKIANAQANAAITKQLDQPLPLEAANKVGMPAGTTMRQAKDMELMAPDLAQKKDYYHFASASNIMDDIFQYAKQVPDVKPGLINKLVGGTKNYVAQIAQTNHAAKMLEIKKGEVALLVRALGESGALATLDVERVKALLPNVWDTMDIRQSKMHDLKQLFESNYQSYVRAHAPMTMEQMKKGGPISSSKTVRARQGNGTPARTKEEQDIYDAARTKSSEALRAHEATK
jgi:hypothetical protein